MKRLKDIWEDTVKRHIRKWKRIGGLGYGKA